MHREIWLAAGEAPPADIIDLATMKRAIAFGGCTGPIMPTSFCSTPKDPIFAVSLFLRQLGWKLTSGLTIATGRADLQLEHGPPGLLVGILGERVQELEEGKLAARLSEQNKGAMVPYLLPVRRLMSKQGNSRQQRMLLKITCGAIFTRTQAVSRGHKIDRSCPTCSMENTKHHRAWLCPCTSALRHEIFGTRTCTEAGEAVGSLWFTRALQTRPANCQVEVLEGCRYLIDGSREEPFTFQGGG